MATPDQNAARKRAYETLTHYLKLAYQGAGLKWNADNHGEVCGLVDDIITAAEQPHPSG